MKKVARLGAMAGLAVAALVVTPTAAFAVDGSVSSTYYSPNGGGAKATAYVDFGSSTTVYWKDIYLNDFCPGDGHRAKLKFMVRYEGDSGWTAVGSREDVGGCDSGVFTESLASWSSSRRINDATVVACVDTVGCASANDSYRDNPHWGA